MNAIEIVSIIVSCAAVFVALNESRLMRRDIKNQNFQNFTSMWYQLDSIFIEHPECRKYFYENAPVTDDDENIELLMAIAEMFDDVFTYSERNALDVPTVDVNSYNRYKARVRGMEVFKYYEARYGAWVNTQDVDKKKKGS